MKSFDEEICNKFNTVQANNKVKLSGKCISYNNCDDVWHFYLDSLSIKGEDVISVTATDCSIVATDSQNREGT
jgi:hypothetical protein